MKLMLALVFAGISLTALAQDAPDFAPLPFEPWCARNYRSESYGLGIGAGYGYAEIAPSTMDERCYRLGREVGVAVFESHSTQQECRVAFLRGMAQGLEADIQTIATPSDCSNAGYSFGRARLENAARKGLVEVAGEACLTQYREGYVQAENHLAPVYPSLNNQVNACYMTGYDDGALFSN